MLVAFGLNLVRQGSLLRYVRKLNRAFN